jgi:hypothetical protein
MLLWLVEHITTSLDKSLRKKFTYGYKTLSPKFTSPFNRLKTKGSMFYIRTQSYRAVNTLHFGYKNQSLNRLKTKRICFI